MKRSVKVTMLAAASAVLLAQAANAQINAGDLILGFTSPTATTDYVVDLGQVSSSSISHLGGLISASQFTAGGAFPGGINGLGVGALMASGSTAAPGDYATISVLRTGGTPLGSAGTESAPATPSGGNFVTAAANAGNSIILGTPLVGDSLSFSSQSTVLTAGTFANNLQLDPRSIMSGSSIVLDLFQSTRLAPVGRNTPASDFTFVGSLMLDFSGASPVADFTPAGFAAVPEPSTYGLIAGAGLLIVSLRRQLRGVKA